MSHQLDQLKQYTTVVADTGDFLQLSQFRPTDATTNPSLILKSVLQPEYAGLLTLTAQGHRGDDLNLLVDRLLVQFGVEILKVIPGRVSTEVDARLSFDTAATVERAKRLIALYAQQGIDRARVLIKIAATWEGIAAAKILEKQGIHCNLTLLFSMAQAQACAQAHVQLISPFVGRIYDWVKKNEADRWDEAARRGANDPGVQSVKEIFAYYKAHQIPTEIMGASFRNVDQILALAGCDLLTISPALLAQMENTDAIASPVTRQLNRAVECAVSTMGVVDMDEASFRLTMNEDAMSTEKLAEGIRLFCADARRLDQLIEAAR